MQNNTIKQMMGLSFGQAGGIARTVEVTDENGIARTKIVAFSDSWVRTRRGDQDRVFTTRAADLFGPPDGLVKCELLEGASARKRKDLEFVPNAQFEGLMHGCYGPGDYCSVLMNRNGQYAGFETKMYKLDARWEYIPTSVIAVGTLTDWLHEDFVQHADANPTAWPILYSAAALFGGQDPATLPPQPAGLPQDLSEACAAEERFRDSRRRALGMSAEQVEAFRQRLTGTPHLDAFEAVLRGERSHV